MKITHLFVRHLQIPLRVRFAQANNSTTTSSSLIVAVETASGIIGFGECCPRTYVTGEDVDSVTNDLVGLRDRLYSMTFSSFHQINDLITRQLPGRIGLAALCGLEGALLDAWSRETQTPIIELLGGAIQPAFEYTGVIPFGDVEKMKPLLSRFQFREIKLKVGADPEANTRRITHIHELYGDLTPVRVDANCGWSPSEGIDLTQRLIDAGAYCVEQPYLPQYDSRMRHLTKTFGDRIDVMADESLTTYESAKRLIAHKACNRFNLKLSKNGGILNSLKIYRLARQQLIPCQLGAHFGETSILTAMGMIFASVATNLEAMEGGLGTYLLKRDVCNNPLMIDTDARIDGARLEQAKGWGIEVNMGNRIGGSQCVGYL